MQAQIQRGGTSKNVAAASEVRGAPWVGAAAVLGVAGSCGPKAADGSLGRPAVNAAPRPVARRAAGAI